MIRQFKVVVIVICICTLMIIVGCNNSNNAVTNDTKVKELSVEETVIEVDYPDIEVSLNIEPESTDQNKLVVKGKTNLPDDFQLMVSIEGDDYNAQDKVVVSEGEFTSATFTKQGKGLKAGEYTIKITSSVNSLQSMEVQEKVGENGEKLKGSNVDSHSVYGNRIKYSTSYEHISTSIKENYSNIEVYDYMMTLFDVITNGGEDYDPEIHDKKVIELASKHFGISYAKADKIFLEEAIK